MSKINAVKNRITGLLSDPEFIKKFIRYLIVGFSSFTIEYILFLIFRKVLPLPDVITNIIVYTFIFWFNFLLNKFFTFRSHKNFKKQLLSYGLLFLFNMVVGNILLFMAITELLKFLFPGTPWIPYYLPKILVMVFIVSWNFILYNKVIYKE